LLQTENGNGKLLFVCCKRKTAMANFRLFAANGNGKWKFVFLDLPNASQRLLLQKTCPSYSRLIIFLQFFSCWKPVLFFVTASRCWLIAEIGMPLLICFELQQ
jgi:hypothetical protein